MVDSGKTTEKNQTAITSEAYDRLVQLFDAGSFSEVFALDRDADSGSGVICGFGEIEGNATLAFSQDVSDFSGAVGKSHSRKIAKLYQMAEKTGCPIVGIFDSKGGKLTYADEALLAYSDILSVSAKLSGVVPQIAVVAGICSGAAAMIAASSDFVIISENAKLYLGKEQSAQQDCVAAIKTKDVKEAISKARELLLHLPVNSLAGPPALEPAAPKMSGFSDMQAILSSVLDEGSVLELYQGYGKGAVAALGAIDGTVVAVAAIDGKTAPLGPEECSKLARIIRFADCFSIPVVSFVDSEGFDASQSDIIKAAASLSGAYFEATTPKVSVITGSAVGSAYLAAASKGANDTVLALDAAVICAISPETAAVWFWEDKLEGSQNPIEDRKKLVEEYKATEASAVKAAQKALVDDVVSSSQLRKAILDSLFILASKRMEPVNRKHSNIQI